MANNSNLVDADLVPELGDEIRIIGKTGKIYGVIVYRSETMIRVRPFSSKTEIYEFPLDENGEYLAELGITETQLDPEKKRRDPHFSKQMEVFPQSVVEFYDREGRTTRKIVQSVVATLTEDGLLFSDGSSMNFQFTGLPEPYISFLDVTNLDEEELAAANNEAVVIPERMFPEEPVATIIDDEDYISKLLEQQGDIIQDEIAQINRPYSEDSQRQDMFVSVMQIIAPKAEQQKNPRILRKAYILTDLLASLKRSVVQLSDQGQPLLNTSKSYLTETLDDVLEHTMPPTILPIVDLRKALYTAEDTWDTPTVEFVAEATALVEVEEARVAFASSVNMPRRTTNAFETYIQSITDSFKVYGVKQGADFVFPQQQNTIEIIRGTPDGAVVGYHELEGRIPTAETATDIAPALARIVNKSKPFFDPVANKTATVQLADTGKHVGNIVLSPELAYTRNANSSSVLLWDIHASEWCRNRRSGFVIRMNETDNSQVFLGKSIDMTVRDLLRSRLQPSLTFMSWANSVIMDSIGLRALEITKEQMDEVCKKMKEGQTNWDLAMADLKQKAIEHLRNGSTYAIRPIVAMKDSQLYSDAIQADGAFSKFMEVFTNKETSLVDYDIALSSAITDISQGTLVSYWSALVSQVSHEHIHESRQVYVQETERQLRKVETERERKRRFVAAPIINKCPHVRDYEVVNAIKNDSERMKSLEGFVRKYNGGMQNNFVKCNKCLQNLVCKHELLLLKEFKIQDQSTAIHKQLVLEFGGPVFMGSYICKNCGQKISNLEFDTHLEFDDEGRPLVGRAVIVPEEGMIDEEDEEATKAEHDARVAYITDSSKDLQRDFVLYQSLRRVFEDAHIVLSDETAKVLLEELKIYLSTLMAKDKYEAIRKKTAAAKLPPYDIFYNQQLIGALGALVIIELQCLPTELAIPNRGCPYTRTGFPIDYIDGVPPGTKVDMGAMQYIECVIGQISSSEPPWNSVLWAAQGVKDDIRKAMIHDTVLASLTSMRGVDKTFAAKPQIPKLTDAQTQRLRAAVQARTPKPVVTKNEDGDRIVVAKLSDLDKLPSQFHPCPRYEQTPTTDVIPLGNAEQFATNIETKPVPKIKPIVAVRIQQIQQDIMYQINKDMNTTAANRTFLMEDVGRIGLGYRAAKLSEAAAAEYETMRQAYGYVDRRDPARPNTGTHMYVPWIAPEIEVAEATPDESIYYKLFSKVCATGENMGVSHEFTYGNICRYCGFHLHDALIYETLSEIPYSAKDVNDRLAAQAKIRKTAVEDACRAIGVEINERTFFELRAVINIKKQVAMVQRTEGGALLERIAGFGGFLPSPAAQDDLRVLLAGMQRVLDPKGDGSQPPLVGNARYEPMRLFYERLDARRVALVNVIAEKGSRGLRTAAQQMEYVDTQLKQFDALISNIRGGECLRSTKRMFILNSRFIRSTTKPVVHMGRWVPSIIKSHVEEINKRMDALQNVSNLFENQIELVKDPESPAGIDFLYENMNAMCEQLGGLLRYWEQTIRPNKVFAVQERINEYTDVLRWAVYSIFLTLFGSDPNPELLAAKQLIADWILFTISHEHQTYEVYSKTPEEIRTRMNDRREREKAEKIEKQDKIDDKEIRKLMRIAIKLGYGEDAILRKSGYSADAEKVRFQELQALGIAGDVNERGAVPQGDEGMGDIRDEDGDI